jgi:hypothetical protein
MAKSKPESKQTPKDREYEKDKRDRPDDSKGIYVRLSPEETHALSGHMNIGESLGTAAHRLLAKSLRVK